MYKNLIQLECVQQDKLSEFFLTDVHVSDITPTHVHRLAALTL